MTIEALKRLTWINEGQRLLGQISRIATETVRGRDN
jgi:hypothetical protein